MPHHTENIYFLRFYYWIDTRRSGLIFQLFFGRPIGDKIWRDKTLYSKHRNGYISNLYKYIQTHLWQISLQRTNENGATCRAAFFVWNSMPPAEILLRWFNTNIFFFNYFNTFRMVFRVIFILLFLWNKPSSDEEFDIIDLKMGLYLVFLSNPPNQVWVEDGKEKEDWSRLEIVGLQSLWKMQKSAILLGEIPKEYRLPIVFYDTVDHSWSKFLFLNT